jgi:PEGA domain-containing protein
MAAAITFWPAEAAAQRRTVRRPVMRSSVVFYRAPFYRSYYYYDPFYWGGGYYGWGYQYPPYWYPRHYGYYEPGVDLRVQVTPRDAEVYLDGYLVGTVDEFDGVFQRLRVPYGEHEVSIYFDGYRTIRQKMLFRPGESYRIRDVMQPVAAGEAAEPRPSPSAPAPGEERGRRPPMARERIEPPMGPPSAADVQGNFGTLAIRVQPAGAEILIDGERWESPTAEDRLTVQLADGTHRLEIRKDGHKPYTAEVEIRRGRTSSLNVVLPPGN